MSVARASACPILAIRSLWNRGSRNVKKVLLLRFAASLVVMTALGGCYYYRSSAYSSSAYAYNPPFLADEWSHWGEVWREWRDDYAGYEPPRTPLEIIPDSPGDRYVWVGGRWR